MKAGSTIALNVSRRSFRGGGYAAGFIVTGTEKVRCGFGNGDCLLFDFLHDTFAVADGTERCPRGSRELLERFYRELSSEEGTPGIEKLQEYVSTIYREQNYNAKTTFASVSLIGEGDNLFAAIASGGDSLIMILNTEERVRRFKSVADMNFAGRSTTAATVNLVQVNPACDRIVLATDGFADYLRQVFGIESPEKFNPLYDEDIVSVIEMLTESFEGLPAGIEYDDVGLLLIEPGRRDPLNRLCVITGGTTSAEESRFMGFEKEEMPDLWLSPPDWQGYQEIIKKAGIGISYRNSKGVPERANSS